MPKFEQQEDGSFLAIMLQSDAQEARVTEAIQSVVMFAKLIGEMPHDPVSRRTQRGNYYRYSELERSLQVIVREAQDALNHIKFLDFPELVKTEGTA